MGKQQTLKALSKALASYEVADINATDIYKYGFWIDKLSDKPKCEKKSLDSAKLTMCK